MRDLFRSPSPSGVMDYEPLRPVTWNGDLVALAGRERFHLLAPRLLAADTPTAELEYAVLLCLYHRQVLTGALPASAEPQVAERWVDALLQLQESDVNG